MNEENWTVEMRTWVNGSPTTVWVEPVESKEKGLKVLWNCGHSRDYGVNYAGYLKCNGALKATLTMQADDTWGIKEHE